MSIAEREATQYFPTQYWPNHEPRKGYPGKECYLEGIASSDIQEAYVAGRTTAPTEAEIEAMARLEAREEAEDGFGEPWDCMVEEDQEAFRANAKRMLLAARKAVSIDV